jgi:hypothetical protein
VLTLRPPERSPPPNDARQTVSPSAREPSEPSTVLREASTLDELAEGFVHRRDGYPDALWGSTPIKTFIMRTRTLLFGRLSVCHLACMKDMPTLGSVISYLF